MFKKLQNKFLIINLISIFTIYILSLITIYLVIYTDIKTENMEELEKGYGITTITPINMENSSMIMPNVEQSNSPGIELQESEINYLNNFSIPFNVILNSNNEIIRINSYVNFTREEYDSLVNLALKNEESNIVKYKDRNWMFKKTQYNETTAKYGEQQENITQITFLDVTEDIESLYKLFMALVGIGFIMLLVIYLFCLYFSKKAIKPIKESWEKQKQFVENASHELKTPIASIKANTEVLLLNKEDTIDNQIKWLEYIKYETNRMSTLTNNLLKLAKSEHIEKQIENKIFDISKVSNELIVPMEILASEKQIQIEKEIVDNIKIMKNEEIIKQVLQILLDNAIKYTNEKGKIKITLKQEDKNTKLIIQNTGVGITKEDLPHIFERFYKVDKARTNEDNSYGLGLAIAQTLIQKIDGKIIVESIPNEITTFTVIL